MIEMSESNWSKFTDEDFRTAECVAALPDDLPELEHIYAGVAGAMELTYAEAKRRVETLIESTLNQFVADNS